MIRVWSRSLTFVASDPPGHSWFASWDPDHPGGLGSDSTVDIDLAVPAARGTKKQSIAAQKFLVRDVIDELAALPSTAVASASAHAWAAVVRAALALIAEGKVLPWVSPQGWDTWRVDPLDANDHALLNGLVAALPAAAHAVPGPTRGSISDPTFAIRAAWDAIADGFIRTPAAGRVGSLTLFAHQSPTQIPHLRPWVNDVAAAHCADARLTLRMHPPGHTSGAATETETDESIAAASADSLDTVGDWTIRFQLQSRLDPSLIVDAADFWKAPTEVMDRLGTQAETVLLAGLRTVTRIVPPLADLLDDIAPTTASISEAELDELLDQLDELADADIDVRWPSELVAPRLTRRLVLSATSPKSGLPTALDLASLLDVDWEFLLDDVALTREELRILGEAKRSVVPLRGRWVRLDRTTLDRLRAPKPEISFPTALAAALGADLDLSVDDGLGDPDELITIRVTGSLNELVQRLHSLAGERKATEPAGLHAELRGYQRRGLAWMLDLLALGFGGCLADDMGLGKTIQVLALHASLHTSAATPAGPTLVICPTSLLNNWAREAERFTPDFPVRVFHGSSRHLDDVSDGEIIVTSYGVVRSDAAQLDAVPWSLVVADEAQHAKNPRSRTARALHEITGGVRIALTGTPVENNLSELWSILNWVVPGLLGPLATFRRTMALPIERDGDRAATERLQSIVKPFLLRRTKRDPGIAPELPEKIERDVIVPLSEEQLTLYKATVDTSLIEVAAAEGISRKGLVLKLLTALKQITNHPAQFLRQDAPLAQRSGKFEALDELLTVAATNDEATLIFSQYVAMGNLIVDHHAAHGRRIGFLHGGLSRVARQRLVDEFQARDLDVLVLSLKAGGTGLNLTAATNVVHYDRWWNPAVEDQATDRAYRIGQHQTVTVHRLIAAGTVEDHVAELLVRKRDLADRVTSAGEGWIGELDDDALADLVTFSGPSG